MAPVLAAAAVLVLSQRPPELVNPQGPAAYAAWLRGQALALDARLLRQSAVCADASVREDAPMSFETMPDPPKGPGGAMALEHLTLDGCGHHWRLNFAIGRSPDGGWSSQDLLPGASRAGALLQTDVLTKLMPFIRQQAPTCADPDWGEASVEREPDNKGTWVEIWPIGACGQDVTMEVTFTPTANGGTDFSAIRLQ